MHFFWLSFVFLMVFLISVLRMHNRSLSLQFSLGATQLSREKSTSSKEANWVDALIASSWLWQCFTRRAAPETLFLVRTVDIFKEETNRSVRRCGRWLSRVWGGWVGGGRDEMRGLWGGAGGGGLHRRTNKYLFRILHSTPLQRVWFPGSTALLMHPSTLYSHPQSTERGVGTERGGERTSRGGVKRKRAKL